MKGPFETFYDTLYTPLIRGDTHMVDAILKGVEGHALPPVPHGYLGPIMLQNCMIVVNTKQDLLRLLHDSGRFDLFNDKTWHTTMTMAEMFRTNASFYTSVANIILGLLVRLASSDNQKKKLLDMITEWPGSVHKDLQIRYLCTSDDLLLYLMNCYVKHKYDISRRWRKRFKTPTLFDEFVAKHEIVFPTLDEKEERLIRSFHAQLKRLRDDEV